MNSWTRYILLSALLGCTDPPLTSDDDASAADDDTSLSDDDTSAVDDDSALPDDDSSPADDDTTSPGDDDTSPGDDDTANPVCGNGLQEEGEICDDGESNGSSPCGCTEECALPAAGNPCDDGNFCSETESCDGGGSCVVELTRSCDDLNPCSVDSCDEPTDSCLNNGPGDTPLSLFDVGAIQDSSTLELTILSSETSWEATLEGGLVEIRTDEVEYTSWEVNECVLTPIRIHGWRSMPAGEDGLPGVAVAHGLGGWAEAENSLGPAAEMGIAALAYTGPGNADPEGENASEGTGSVASRLFDTVPDPRGSWFWGHAVAGMRALTVLETTWGVDGSRMGMAGYSGGGVATLIANGVDSRIHAAAAIASSGYLGLAAAATPNPGWEVDLLTEAGLTTASPEWVDFQAWMDPQNFLASAHGDVLMAVGSQDGFFPLTSAVATWDGLALSGGNHRVFEVANWDHGWWALYTGEEAAEDIDDVVHYWVDHHFGLDAALTDELPMPQVEGVSPWYCDYGGGIIWWCTALQVSLPGGSDYEVDGVRLWVSADSAFSFYSVELEDVGGGIWQGTVLVDPYAVDWGQLVYFAEAEYRNDGDVFGLGRSYKITSRPYFPAGFSPYIIPIDGG